MCICKIISISMLLLVAEYCTCYSEHLLINRHLRRLRRIKWEEIEEEYNFACVNWKFKLNSQVYIHIDITNFSCTTNKLERYIIGSVVSWRIKDVLTTFRFDRSFSNYSRKIAFSLVVVRSLRLYIRMQQMTSSV